MPDSVKTLSFIGCGRLGQTLGRLWAAESVFEIRQILNRTQASAQRAAVFIGAGQAIDSFSSLQPADIFLIAAPDDVIEALARQLASCRLRPGTVVFHCSGALPSTVLKSLSNAGALVASVHPIKSFANAEEASLSFSGTWCGMEGDKPALDILRPAFEAIRGRPVEIHTDDKLIYHAAAVFASNYLVTLLDAALQAYVKAGIPEAVAREMIVPLVRGTVENVSRLGPEKALTGPIARGDHNTVTRQYKALGAWNRQSARLYKLMGLFTARLAKRRKQALQTSAGISKEHDRK